jgi:hypothetical protein
VKPIAGPGKIDIETTTKPDYQIDCAINIKRGGSCTAFCYSNSDARIPLAPVTFADVTIEEPRATIDFW